MESILALKKKFRFSFPWRGSRGKHFSIDLINYYRALDVFSFWISWSEMKSCFVSTLSYCLMSQIFPQQVDGKMIGDTKECSKLLQHLHHRQSFENWQNLDRLIFWPFFRLKNISREEIGMNLLVFLCQVLRDEVLKKRVARLFLSCQYTTIIDYLSKLLSVKSRVLSQCGSNPQNVRQ